VRLECPAWRDEGVGGRTERAMLLEECSETIDSPEYRRGQPYILSGIRQLYSGEAERASATCGAMTILPIWRRHCLPHV
jgi:hypothetical protein